MNIALIVFAGTGSRIHSEVPKQFVIINGRQLVSYTIETFQKSKLIDEIVLVTLPDYVDYVKKMCENYDFDKVKHVIAGGSTRQESVKFGLEQTSYSSDDNILIHDGDRPLVSESIIFDNIEALKSHQVVCTYIEHKDSSSEVSNLGRSKKVNGVPYDIQTPQSFKYGLIKKYHIEKSDLSVSDDISLLESDYPVQYVLGSKDNFKVTTDQDLEYIKKRL